MGKVTTYFIIAAVIAAAAYFLYFNNQGALEIESPKKLAVLVASDLQLAAFEGMRAGLEELGYREGLDMVFAVFNPEGDKELTNEMAAQIVASKPDLILTFSTTASVAMKEANEEAKINVIFADVGNFSRLGIENPQKPGGFMSGITTDNTAVGNKRVEILKEALPGAKVFAIINNPASVNNPGILAAYQAGADAVGVELKTYPASSLAELESALERVKADNPDGFLTVPDAVNSENAELVAGAMKEAKIPSVDFNSERGAKLGYLLMYGTSRFSVGKEGARIVEQVLKGERLPGDIPVEFAKELELEINSATAEAIGIELPGSLLLRATKIYEE